jgi:hypothetical protein
MKSVGGEPKSRDPSYAEDPESDKDAKSYTSEEQRRHDLAGDFFPLGHDKVFQEVAVDAFTTDTTFANDVKKRTASRAADGGNRSGTATADTLTDEGDDASYLNEDFEVAAEDYKPQEVKAIPPSVSASTLEVEVAALSISQATGAEEAVVPAPLVVEATGAPVSKHIAGVASEERLLPGEEGKAHSASDARSMNDNMSENYIYTDYDEDFESCISEEIRLQKQRGQQQQHPPGSSSRGSGDSVDPFDDGGATRTTITSVGATALMSPSTKFAARSASSSLATGTDLGGSIDVAVRATSSGALGGAEKEEDEKESPHVSRKPSNVGIVPAGDVSDLEDSLC